MPRLGFVVHDIRRPVTGRQDIAQLFTIQKLWPDFFVGKTREPLINLKIGGIVGYK